MILNLGSLAFNANINGGGGTPAWGTELGQGDGYRFHFEEMNDFLTSMVYMSISDTDNIYCPLGKGGSRREDYDFVLASLYDKVFVNGQRISDAKFILLLVKQIQGDFHIGRRSLKYNPRITYKGIDYNKQCYDKIPSVLGITQNAAWFVDEIYTNNQDELHFVAYVLDALNEKVYASNELRKADFISKIQGERQNNRIIRKSLMDDSDETKSLQKIYYGAPGTGKSHTINEVTKNVNSDFVFRTTFHPDSDYSTFVGAYKPAMKKLPIYNSQNGDKIGEEEKIAYSFVAQSFLKAYVTAWQNREQSVYLVIEEINRGNCAQIFGDLFQLLDRKEDGVSEYPIKADQDMQDYLKEKFADCDGLPEKIKSGDELQLPSNLYIWATMNTSDQSLFPIDSAFKRRWDWEYIKISDAHKNWKIKIGLEFYDWWQFVQAINYFIFDATQSEDKNLGYFFVKANDDIITAKTFVSKVIFYLYTDVFKDYAFGSDIFKGLNEKEMTFQSFYKDDGSINDSQVVRFIENVIYSDSLPEEFKTVLVAEETENGKAKFTLNGEPIKYLYEIANKVVSNYANEHKDLGAQEIRDNFISWFKGTGIAHIVETDEEYQQRSHQPSAERSRTAVNLPNGEIIHVSTQWRAKKLEDNFFKFINICAEKNLGVIEYSDK